MIGKLLRQNTTIRSILAKSVFFAILGGLAIVHLFGGFKGMSHRDAMEAASVGREIARGNGLNNKVIYPIMLYDRYARDKELALTEHQTTNVPPGYAMMNAGVLYLIDGGNYDKYRIKPGSHVYTPDRALALASLLFLVVSIIFTYQVVKQLFDSKIANTTAFVMLMSGSIWQYVQSCLPHMFLLMLFSILIWALHRGYVFYEQHQRTPWLTVVSCAVIFGIMIITKWLTVWMFVGYLAAILTRFKTRGSVAIVTLGIVTLFVIPVIVFNLNVYGTPGGQAAFSIKNSLARSEEIMLRNFGEEAVRIDGLLLNFAKITVLQFTDIIRLLGGLIIAPIFFLSLIHKFKREETNQIKFAILYMWFPAVIGMSIYGGKELSSSAQIHILFAPIMAALGLSIISILRAKLAASPKNSIMANLHLYVAAFLCASPMIVSVPQLVKDTFASKGKGQPNAPYFQTAELTNDLHDLVNNANKGKDRPPVIISDQPAATAWYSDIHSIALPKDPSQIEAVDAYVAQQDHEITGIHTSALSTSHIYSNYDYASVMPLVNLPILPSISGIPASPSLRVIASSFQAQTRSPWERIAKTFKFTRPIMNANRKEFKDFGHHIFHSRNKLDE